MVERCVRDAEVVGSNPVASTTDFRKPHYRAIYRLCDAVCFYTVTLCYSIFKTTETVFLKGALFWGRCFPPLYSLFYAAQFLKPKQLSPVLGLSCFL